MTEEEAQGWCRERFGDVAVERLAAFGAMLVEENGRQNLIAPSTVERLWSRHLADSAQLVAFAGESDRPVAANLNPSPPGGGGSSSGLSEGVNSQASVVPPPPSGYAGHLPLAGEDGDRALWLDIGTGGGLPGLVCALLTEHPFVLVEPRRLRAGFLQRCVGALGLAPRVTVRQARVETIRASAAIISARAVAALPALLASARHCADRDTLWLLPRGQSGAGELQSAAMPSSPMFHVEHSLTDPDAVILVGRGAVA